MDQSDVDLRRLRLAAAGGFFVQGLVFISLTTRLPDVRDEWDLSETDLSLLLLMMVLLAGVGSLAAERLAKRQDSATVLRIGFGLAAVGLPTLAAAPGVRGLRGRYGGLRAEPGCGRRQHQHASSGRRA